MNNQLYKDKISCKEYQNNLNKILQFKIFNLINKNKKFNYKLQRHFLGWNKKQGKKYKKKYH